MSVCPDCGNPWDNNHPDRACGAGPVKRTVDTTRRFKIEIPNSEVYVAIWYCSSPMGHVDPGWRWHYEAKAPDGAALCGVSKGEFSTAAKAIYGYAQHLLATDRQLLEQMLPNILAHFVEVDEAPRAGNGPNRDPELLALANLLDNGKHDLPPVKEPSSLVEAMKNRRINHNID